MPYSSLAKNSDFGFIRFNDNASYTNVTANEGVIDNVSSLNVSENPEKVITEDLGDNVTVSKKNSFSLWVPTALVLQADYNFENYFYVSGQYTHGFSRNLMMGIQRPHVLNITPRYERIWFEVSFPLALYNFQEFRTGLMVRFAGISLGTDKLGTILAITNVTGFDFYFHVAIKIHKKRACLKKGDLKDRDVSKCRKY